MASVAQCYHKWLRSLQHIFMNAFRNNRFRNISIHMPQVYLEHIYVFMHNKIWHTGLRNIHKCYLQNIHKCSNRGKLTLFDDWIWLHRLFIFASQNEFANNAWSLLSTSYLLRHLFQSACAFMFFSYGSPKLDIFSHAFLLGCFRSHSALARSGLTYDFFHMKNIIGQS